MPFPELKNPPCGLQGPWILWPCSPAIDGDFQPQEEEEDDEETIEVEEQQEGNDAETQRREIELLRHEGELPLEELLRSLPPQLLGVPSSPSQTPSSHDSDTHDGPEENVEEEPSQDLEVHIEEVQKGRFREEVDGVSALKSWLWVLGWSLILRIWIKDSWGFIAREDDDLGQVAAYSWQGF